MENKLRKIREEVVQESNPSVYFHKLQYRGLAIRKKEELRQGLGFYVALHDGSHLHYNAIGLFRRYIHPNYSKGNEPEWIYIRSCIEKIRAISNRRFELTYSEIDATEALTDYEREMLYSALTQVNNDLDTIDAINHWISNIDANRKALSTSNFIDDL